MKDNYKLLLTLFAYIATIYAITASFIIWP
jgi:hypothetical protein